MGMHISVGHCVMLCFQAGSFKKNSEAQAIPWGSDLGIGDRF